MASQTKLRRLAARALRIIEKNSGVESLSMVSDTVKQTAQNYLNTYDKIQNLQRSWDKEYAEGKKAVNDLKTSVTSFLPVIKIKYPSLVQNLEISNVPDDLMNEVNNFLDNLNEASDAPAEVKEKIIPSLETALGNATKEWMEADHARTDLQKAQEELRNAASAFSYNLGQFRRIIASSLGRTSYDYQALRETKAGNKMEGDPEDPSA